MRRKMTVIISAILCLVLVMGCSSNSKPSNSVNKGTESPSSNAPSTSEPSGLKPPSDDAFKNGPVEVKYWSVFSGTLAEGIDELITEFNASQDHYVIVREFQGGAADLTAKLQASRKEDLPTMFTGAVENVGYFMNSGYTKPLQEFIEADPSGIDLNGIYPHLVSSYSDGSANMIGFPMGNSFAGIFYNAEILKAANIDPYSIKSYEDMYEASKTIVEGGHAKYGVGFHNHGYYLNAALAVEGVPSFDKNNGYDGIPTKAVYGESPTKDAIYTYLESMQNLYRDGLAVPYGANANDEVVPLFSKGELAMFHGVISFYTRILISGGDSLDIGMIPMPSATKGGRNTGVPPGGTGHFIADNNDPVKQWGAYEFIKFTAKAESQAAFAVKTGYLPIGSSGAETEAYQKFVKEQFPRVQVALDAQKNGDQETKTPFVPISNELLKANILAIEQVANDPNYDINRAITDAQKTITEAIELWEMSNR